MFTLKNYNVASKIMRLYKNQFILYIHNIDNIKIHILDLLTTFSGVL